jgi:hypothetical protein
MDINEINEAHCCETSMNCKSWCAISLSYVALSYHQNVQLDDDMTPYKSLVSDLVCYMIDDKHERFVRSIHFFKIVCQYRNLALMRGIFWSCDVG